MKPAYYNEIDPFAAAWLRNLVVAGHLPAGDVDERSIVDVRGDDLRGYGACHFFAGIGGWPYALRLAGIPDDWPIWTGSCPCQPFSVAGAGKGTSDERHLWPAFRRLIEECRPPVVFGEQVASKDGRLWLAGVRADLEGLGYACGAADLCAAGIGAPHIRQRLYWVADADWDRQRSGGGRVREPEERDDAGRGSEDGGLGDADDAGRQGNGPELRQGRDQQLAPEPGGSVATIGVGDTLRERGRGGHPEGQHADHAHAPGEVHPCWGSFDLIPCGDGKVRRIEPGIAPVAHGVPGRVGRLRAYGNAIVPPLAAEFVMAWLEAEPSETEQPRQGALL